MSAFAQICAALQSATVDDPAVRKPAEEQLHQWEVQPEFHSTLQDVTYDRTLDPRIRHLAVLLLKNGVQKYWRKNIRVGAIGPEEKAKIRAKCLTVFDEDTKQLATQNAVIVAKLASFDFPQEWPDLLHVLVQIVQSTFAAVTPTPEAALRNQTVQHNSLYMLYQVIKEIGLKQLPSKKRMFQQVAPDVFRYASSIFYDQANQFMTLGEALVHSKPVDMVGAESNLRVAYSALKCLRRTILYGFVAFETVEEPARFFRGLVDYLQKFLHLRTFLPNGFSNTGGLLKVNLVHRLGSVIPAATKGIYEIISKMILQIGKFYIDLQKAQSQILHFILAPGSMDIVKFYWSLVENYVPGSADVMYERYIVQALILVKNLLKNSEFNVVSKSELEHQMGRVREILSTQLITPPFATTVCQTLVSRYLVLSKDDLDMWEDDPEAFIQEEEEDHWEYIMRKCAEKVLMDLVSTNRDLLSPVLINMLTHVTSVENPDAQALLLKDAVYCAVGLCAHDLYDYVDLVSWFRTKLRIEATIRDPSYKYIRRRVAWVLGCWVPVKYSPEIQGDVYTTLLSLMNPNEDTVVRLTAVLHLKICIDVFEFEPQLFMPYLENAVALSIQLLNEVDENEIKMKILNCLTVIIERMEEHVKPYALRITRLLPGLWEQSEDQHMFRAAIVETLSKLVAAVGANSMSLHGFVVPIIGFSVDVANPAHVYLLEDGIDLWLSLVRNTTDASRDLLSLFPHATALLEYGSESLKKVLKLVEGYIILAPHAVLRAYAVPLMTRLTEMFNALQPDAVHPLVHCVDITLQACYAEECFGAIRDVAIQTGLVSRLIQTVLEGRELGIVLVRYVTLLARLALYDAPFFVGFCKQFGQMQQPPVSGCLANLVLAWCDKVRCFFSSGGTDHLKREKIFPNWSNLQFDSMGYGKQRKITAMALANLLATNDPEVVAAVQPILVILSSVLFDVKDLDQDGALIYTYEPRDDDEDESSPDGQRRRELTDQDPVNTPGPLSVYFGQRIAQCARLNGGEEEFRQRILAGVDPVIVEQMQTLLAS
ncbi:Importin-11 [Borealophlyctis nickersoniae]|nr:Importin-11 [Borealophlyctis nickersoniae]